MTTMIRYSFVAILCILTPQGIFSVPPCKNDNSFYFNTNPKSIVVREGSRAFLECNVSNLCNVQFHWTIGGDLVANTSRRYQNGSNLIITRVNKSLDSDEFHCIATVASSGFSQQSEGATLSIQWLTDNVSVEFTGKANTNTSQIDNVSLNCMANGTEKLQIRWFRNGVRIKNDQANSDKYFFSGRTLHIRRPSFAQNGVYSCEALNSAGAVRSWKNYHLFIPFNGLPNVKVIPQDRLAKQGSDVIFNCQFEGSNDHIWLKIGDDKFATNTTGRVRRLSNGTLLIKDVNVRDVGYYECRIYGSKNYYGYAALLTLSHINAFSRESFKPSNEHFFVGRNKDVEVTCIPPEGNPPPKAYWRNSRVKIGNIGRITADDDLKLTIQSASSEDSGEYHCVAENLAGTAVGTINVYVTNQPKITFHPASFEVDEGSLVPFTCSYEGDPYPATLIEWRKTGEAMPFNHRDPRIKIFPANGTLMIHHATLSDAGHYDCVIKTGGQNPVVSKQAVLTVREKLKFSPKPVSKKLMLGSNAQIPCKATGHFKPTIIWLPQRDWLSFSSKGKPTSFPDNVRDKNGVLYFNSVRFQDSGFYVCLAFNGQGYINETIKIEVYVFPKILHGPRNTTAVRGTDVTFNCLAEGVPTPIVQWYFNGLLSEKWNFNFTMFNNNNSLIIKNVSAEQAGQYVCMAGNSGSFMKQDAVLCIKDSADDHFANCGDVLGKLQANFNDDDEKLYENAFIGTSSRHVVIKVILGLILYVAVILCLAVGCKSYCTSKRKTKMVKDENLRGEDNPGSLPVEMNHYSNVIRNRGNGQLLNGDGEYLLKSQNFPQSTADGNDTHLLRNCRGIDQASSYAHAVGDNASSACYGGGDSGIIRCPSPAYASSIVSAAVDKLRCERTRLEFKRDLGSGQFGPVQLMRIIRSQADCHEPCQLVFTKIFTKCSDASICAEMTHEVDMYYTLSHPNVVRLIGSCTEKYPNLIIYEYLEFGDLKSYLKASRHPNGYCRPLTKEQILSIACQVASGMEHLTSVENFVHKDLAARNILISADFTPKICHLSLSEPFINEYFTYQSQTLPIRWMSHEALGGDYSPKSDVWSFGVLVWELYSMGELPYKTLPNEEIVDLLLHGQLPPLHLPNFVQVSVKDLVASCWHKFPQSRPTFQRLHNILSSKSVEYNI